MWRREARYYRRRNITQKIAGVTPSSLVNYRELPIIIRTVKVFTIVVGQAARGRDAEPQWAHLVCEFAEVYPPGFRVPSASSFLRRIYLSPKCRYEIHLMRHFANKSFPSSSRKRPSDLRSSQLYCHEIFRRQYLFCGTSLCHSISLLVRKIILMILQGNFLVTLDKNPI